MKVMTWNVNRFNGNGWNYQNHNWEDNNNSERNKNAESIFEFVTQNVVDDSDIAILQEFPLCESNWKEATYHEKFKNSYHNHKVAAWYYSDQDKNYCVNARSITMAVVKEDSKWMLRRLSEHPYSYNKTLGRNVVYYSNRYIELYSADIKINLLGVHAKDAYNVRCWLAQKCNKEFVPHFIVGDCNAGNYIIDYMDKEFELNRNEFMKLSEGFIDVCNGMVTTNYNRPTQIDHILIQNSQKFFGTIKTRDVVYSKEYSDHFPVIAEVDI